MNIPFLFPSFSPSSQKHSLGSTLLDEVYRHVDLLERDYFGLAYSDSGLMVTTLFFPSFSHLEKIFVVGCE